MPAFIVGILLMSEYIGAKSTIGTAQAAFESGIAASWSVLGAAIGFPLFGLILVKRIYNTGKITISGAIAEKYGNSTKNIISLIMIYALLLVNVGNYVSGAAAISTVLKVNLPVAAFITAIVSTFYFAFGGMKGVASGHHVTQRVEIRRSADHSGFCPVQNRRLLADDGEDAGLLLDMGWQHWCWHDLRPRLIGTIGSIFAPSLSFRPLAQPKTFGQRNAPPDRLLFLPAYRLCHRHYRRRGEIPASRDQQPVCPPGLSAGHEPVAGRSGDNVTCGIDFRQRKYRSPRPLPRWW